MGQVIGAGDRLEGGGLNAMVAGEGFFDHPMLGHFQGARPRPRRHLAVKGADAGQRDILELIGHRVDGGGEAGQRRQIVIFGACHRRRHLAGRAVGLGRENMAAIAQTGRRQGGHPAQLAAAENAKSRAGRQGRHASSTGRSPTAAVCRARQASRAARTLSSWPARIEAASKAALTAPARPMARVPTGTPAGI